MPLQTIENQRLYRQIADQISELIASGEFAEGSRLPSERELASQLGVSRPSVREAIIALEIAGKVEVRGGTGVVVAARRPVALTTASFEGQGPFELLRARELIECGIVAEAARCATAQDLEAIRAAVDEMQGRQERQVSFDAADREFHVSIARATHNAALVSVVRDAWDLGRGAIWKRMEQHFQTAALRASILQDHRAISESLDARDPRRARSRMQRHLRRVAREFGRRWTPAAVSRPGPESVGPENGKLSASG
ncbi:MAG TPA: FadR/GntR family transcriptional regulator [Polyangiaceae bacterium]|nr:FadR/GntR family transcriptional regulator [Polyangiaceae bacterium]